MRLTSEIIKELTTQLARENILLDPEFEFLRSRVYTNGGATVRFRGYNAVFKQDPRPGRGPSTFLLLMEQMIGQPRLSEAHSVDHVNRDWLDWRRENLRWATKTEQNSNQTRRKKSDHQRHQP